MATSLREQQKEIVRLLALQHQDLKLVSQLSGIDYALVRQWESRRKRKALKQAQSITDQAGVTVSQNPVTIVADNISNEIEYNGKETKLSLSRAAKRLAKDSETVTLRDSKHVKNVAQTAAIVHPEMFGDKRDRDPAQVAVNIAILGT